MAVFTFAYLKVYIEIIYQIGKRNCNGALLSVLFQVKSLVLNALKIHTER